MNFSVYLQDPFSFRPFWWWLGLALLLAAGLLLLAGRLLPRLKFGRQVKERLLNQRHYDRLRRKYLKRIDSIEAAYEKKKRSPREVHQALSRELRLFYRDATGKQLDRMVYSEIREVAVDGFADMIRELYEPEFALHSEADPRILINACKGFISKW